MNSIYTNLLLDAREFGLQRRTKDGKRMMQLIINKIPDLFTFNIIHELIFRFESINFKTRHYFKGGNA